MAEITVAESAGFCFGVDRAVKLCYQALEQHPHVATLGPIIHNQNVVDDLTRRGARIVDSIADLQPDECVVIRSHGVSAAVYDQLEQAGQTLQIQIQRRMQAANMQLEHAAALTASLSPYRVLARGYAMITTGRGQILPADQLEPDKTIYIRSASRRAKCRVEAVEEIDESTQKL